MLKYCLKRIVYFLFHIFWILPVKKKRIYFESFAGKQISCNPLSIYNYLKSNYNDFEYIWCYNGKKCSFNMVEKNVKIVKNPSLKRIVAYMTSCAIISNMGMPTFIPFRKNQMIINTWHGGGAYKKVSLKQNQYGSDWWNKLLMKKLQKKHSHQYKIVSSSEKFTQIMSSSLLLNESQFMSIGMPRNDIFFSIDLYENIKYKTRSKIGVGEEFFLVLYAPTYRGSTNHAEDFDCILNVDKIKYFAENKFCKNIVIAFRSHHIRSSVQIVNTDSILDVTEYPNMQELLCAADMLITDYSSSMWDYSFTGKPCILFAPDIEKYQKERGFYTDPYTWGFPIAKTNEELCKIIEEFDIEDFIKKIEIHHAALGSYENGNATERICNFIVERVKYIAD